MRYSPRLFVQDSCILAKFFFAFLLTADEVEVNRKAQITRPLFSHLDRTSLVSKGFISGKKITFSCGTYTEKPNLARWGS